MAYDPEARRETPLAIKLKARIRRSGPIAVRDYMRTCLEDAEHGYYRTRAPIGRAGDFVTAPEISQIFGELIGLWAAVVWQQMGQPQAVRLVEIGPGRGTMMADMLRVARSVPAFAAALELVLVETNPVLIAAQREQLGDGVVRCQWVTNLADVSSGPAIIVGNELLDCFPVHQIVATDAGWVERAVGIDARGELKFSTGSVISAAPELDHASPIGDGAIVERHDLAVLTKELGRLALAAPLAALFIDYGYEGPAVGDTLQAVRNHTYEHALTSPGEADLTAHVDFNAVSDAAHSAGLVVDGSVTQAEFLGSLGIAERASRLMAANPARTAEIEAGVMRLMAPTGMGARFRAIGLRAHDFPPLPGLQRMDKFRDGF